MQCFYVASGTCNEIGFFASLTANQPIEWMVSSGVSVQRRAAGTAVQLVRAS